MKTKKQLPKLAALILSVIMVLGVMPVTVGADVELSPIVASYEELQAVTYTAAYSEIIHFEPLPYYIAEQAVPLGTEFWQLNLPPVLMAVVRSTPTMATPTDAPVIMNMNVWVTWEAWP